VKTVSMETLLLVCGGAVGGALAAWLYFRSAGAALAERLAARERQIQDLGAQCRESRERLKALEKERTALKVSEAESSGGKMSASRILKGSLRLMGGALLLVGSPMLARDIQGQIVAFRPAERIMQSVSFVENRETFLFLIPSSHKGAKPQYGKLIYNHVGYSELNESLLDRTPILNVRVKRNHACDESYGSFVLNSPVIRNASGDGSGTEKAVFVPPFRDLRIPPSEALSCYVVRGWTLHRFADSR
jgi:hypothetical protein